MCVPKITIIWCTIPKIKSETGRIFCHLGQFFALLPPNDPKIKFWKKKKQMPGNIIFLNINVYHKWRSYDTRFLKYKVREAETFLILGHFLPSQPLTTRKIKILKLKKTLGDIIILHIYTINNNHMIYSSWDMEHDRQNF